MTDQPAIYPSKPRASLARKSALAAMTALALTGGRFVLLAVIARRLAPDGFGQFVYAQWLVDIVFLVSAVGVNGVASRYFAEYAHSHRKKALKRLWTPWAIVIPLLAGAATAGAAAVFAVGLSPSGYVLLGSWAVVAGWWAMQTAALTGEQRFGTLLIGTSAVTVVAFVVAVAVPQESASVELFMAAMIVASISALLVSLVVIPRPEANLESHDDPRLPWSLIRTYALNVWVASLLWSLVWSRGELPLVRLSLGDAGVAEYAAAITIFFGAVQGVQLWVAGIGPHLTELLGAGRLSEAAAIARRLSDIQLLVAGGFAIVISALAPELISAWFGAAYRSSAPTLMVLVLGLATLSAALQSLLLQVTTNATFTRNLSIGALIVLYALAFLATPIYGTIGAAFARVIAMWFMFGSTYVAARRTFGTGVISGRNVLVVAGAVASSASASELLAGDPLPIRVIWAAAAATVLGLLIRSPDGILAVQIGHAAMARLRRLAGEVA